MKPSRALALGILTFALLATVTSVPALRAETGPGVRIGAQDIGGVVTSAHGPEAGVWVIALTNDLPTTYAKIVVTDERGRYLIPDLPQRHLSGVGARLRARRLAGGRPQSRATRSSCTRDRAERRRRGPHLSRGVLVRAAHIPPPERLSGNRTSRQRDRDRDQDARPIPRPRRRPTAA